jgi:hypothetical protein
MSKVVLIENLTPMEANIIEESTDDGKNHYLSGIMMMSNIKNQNGRNYPLEEITAAVDYAKARITSGNFIAGELNHPNDLQINLERVSHIITEINMDGNNAVGKMKLMNTPMGNLAKSLMEGGLRLGVSSRGSGNVNEGSVSDFQFVTVDIVSNPSAPDAYPNLVREGIENKKIMSLAEAVVEDKAAQKYLTREIKIFLETMAKYSK